MKRKLSPAQRILLISKKAWSKLDKSGAIDEPFEEWRQRESIACVGVRISAATRAQLDRLETHFLVLGGQAGKAFEAEMGEGGHAKRQRHVIRELAGRLDLPADYAANKHASQLTGIIINLKTQLKNHAQTR